MEVKVTILTQHALIFLDHTKGLTIGEAIDIVSKKLAEIKKLRYKEGSDGIVRLVHMWHTPNQLQLKYEFC